MSIADELHAVNYPPEIGVVLDRLRQQFNLPVLSLAEPPHKLSGGFWAEMWTIQLRELTGTELPSRIVLRLAPDPDMATWETVVQASVAQQGYPTPAVRASDFTCADGNRAWCIMDHAAGLPLLGGLSGVRALTALPRLATALPDTLARAAADLHRLDPEPVEMALAQATGRTIGVDGLLEHYQAKAHEFGDAPLRRAIHRLATTRPGSKVRVVCHGDLHPFNLLANNGHVTVLDWTASQIAHPAYDLAFTHLLIANPPLDTPKPIRPIINAAARRIANRFISTYRKIGPHPIDTTTLDWYRDLQGCRILTDLAGWRAAGQLDAHQGHPWFAMEPSLEALLKP